MPRMQSLVQVGFMVCSLATSPAAAQVAGEDLNGPPPANTAQPRSSAQGQPFIERFRAANPTGDGRLTLAQAQAGHMPMVARHFDAIDAQHKGYVTLQDIRAYRQQMRAMREGGDNTVN